MIALIYRSGWAPLSPRHLHHDHHANHVGSTCQADEEHASRACSTAALALHRFHEGAKLGLTAVATAVHAHGEGLAIFTDPTTHQTFSGWLDFGGTSIGAPLTAGMYALAGTPTAGSIPASTPYKHPADFNDITTGSNGTYALAYLCTSRPGYDGPTGLGSPNGTIGLTDAADPIATYNSPLGGPSPILGNTTGPETSVDSGLLQPNQSGQTVVAGHNADDRQHPADRRSSCTHQPHCP